MFVSALVHDTQTAFTTATQAYLLSSRFACGKVGYFEGACTRVKHVGFLGYNAIPRIGDSWRRPVTWKTDQIKRNFQWVINPSKAAQSDWAVARNAFILQVAELFNLGTAVLVLGAVVLLPIALAGLAGVEVFTAHRYARSAYRL